MVSADEAAVLRRALGQLADLLDGAPGRDSLAPTPCAQWTLSDLVDHVVAAPARFARMARGEEVDWSATPPATDDPAATFRAAAEELLAVVREPAGGGGGIPLDWQCAELAVHTYDLATSLGRSTADLDPEVAERGLAFMRAGLTEDNRSPAFGPERPAPEGADAYRRIAAFAGRSV
jgi:uncharacterized protein (TIGR03086 family)